MPIPKTILRNNKIAKQGFTLIELLLTLAISSILITSIYSILNLQLKHVY